MAEYHDIADALRSRITAGEFTIGDKLPSIADLMAAYTVHSLGTVRAAQQLLVEEGLIETRQGSGAFVVGTESLKALDIPTELTGLRDRLTTVLAAMTSQTHRRITLDLDDPAEPHTHFVLTTALGEIASGWRHDAADEASQGDHARARMFTDWAAAAQHLLERVEAA